MMLLVATICFFGGLSLPAAGRGNRDQLPRRRCSSSRSRGRSWANARRARAGRARSPASSAR
ncbi:MAG: hypothetical protein MZW92_71575 [Comamonadaceae bacterium]|nr:hypothetical protein [Comamonadaceae bacterium]